MARLIDEFTAAMDARAGRGLPRTVAGTMERFGWSTRDLAQRFGVSDRTARRWRQQDRIPDKRREDWNRERQNAARERLRGRMERGGLKGLTVEGQYKVSKTKGKASGASAIRVMPGNKISGAQMRDVFDAIDRGDTAAADDALNEALAEAYEAPGLVMDDVEGLSFDL